MPHKLSEIQVTPIQPKDGVVGFASFVLDDALFLGSIAIVTRPHGGFRLCFPTKKIGDRSIGIYYPITKDFADEIEKKVIKQLENVWRKF